MPSMPAEVRQGDVVPLGDEAPVTTLGRLTRLDKPHRDASVNALRAVELEARVLDIIRIALHGAAREYRGQYPLTTWSDILLGIRRPFSLLDLCRLATHPTKEAHVAVDAALRLLASARGYYLADKGQDVAFDGRGE